MQHDTQTYARTITRLRVPHVGLIDALAHERRLGFGVHHRASDRVAQLGLPPFELLVALWTTVDACLVSAHVWPTKRRSRCVCTTDTKGQKPAGTELAEPLIDVSRDVGCTRKEWYW